MTLKVGSLFAGAGGLDIALGQVLPTETVWFSEFDPAASKVLAHHWPEVPNLGDVTLIDWAGVPEIDILTAGFPCQDVSVAGGRKGLAEGTRTGLWSHVVTAIENLNPRLVVLENVRGLLSAKASRSVAPGQDGLVDDHPIRALGAVLGDLASLGFDAEWGVLPASAVGAPHKRDRVFIVAQPADAHRNLIGEYSRESSSQEVGPQAGDGPRDHRGVRPAGDGGRAAERLNLIPTPQARDGKGKPSPGFNKGNLPTTVEEILPTPKATDYKRNPSPAEMRRRSPALGAIGGLLPTPRTTDANGAGKRGQGGPDLRTAIVEVSDLVDVDWGKYTDAVRRWEALTRPAPAPTEVNRNGGPRLAAKFAEWMMGWPDGHATSDELGLPRTQQLKVIGNGVVPAQGAEAIAQLLVRLEEA